MFNLHFLGTCSGTEPIPGMHHSSFILEINHTNYWFEAGENCAHRAVSMGIDTMNTACIFVSHCHLDHIGGMPTLLSCLRKHGTRYGQKLIRDNTLRIFMSDLELLNACKRIACGAQKLTFPFTIEENTITDGLLYEDSNIRVSALHNTHLKEDGSNGWHAFSFLIESDGQTIVFSGDVKRPSELDPLIRNGCDILIMETGHHQVEDVLQYAADHGVKRLFFTHHGRRIIKDRQGVEQLIAEFADAHSMEIQLCHDGMTVDC